MVQSVAQVLEERGTRYGQFINQAGIAQGLHQVLEFGMQVSGKTRFDFYVDELEAINMIVNKIARIYNGDPHYSDSWRDIAGYATLVADRLDNDMAKQQQLIEAKEQYERNRDPSQTEADRSCDEGCDCERETTSPEPGSDNRPTGQSELRRLPVSGTSEETRIAVRTTPRN